MDTYEILFNDGDINVIIDSTNEMLNKMTNNAFTMCHGRYHAMFVVNTVERILKSLSYDLRFIELGKIAALLHDIGCITGRWNHAKKSAVLAEVFLSGSIQFLPEEINMIVQAIEDHSNGVRISSAMGAALLIADKVDFSRKRNLPSKNVDAGYQNNLEIESVEIDISEKVISINSITTKAFSIDIFKSGYTRYNMVLKASEFLGCTCRFLFNDKEEMFDQ